MNNFKPVGNNEKCVQDLAVALEDCSKDVDIAKYYESEGLIAVKNRKGKLFENVSAKDFQRMQEILDSGEPINLIEFANKFSSPQAPQEAGGFANSAQAMMEKRGGLLENQPSDEAPVVSIVSKGDAPTLLKSGDRKAAYSADQEVIEMMQAATVSQYVYETIGGEFFLDLSVPKTKENEISEAPVVIAEEYFEADAKATKVDTKPQVVSNQPSQVDQILAASPEAVKIEKNQAPQVVREALNAVQVEDPNADVDGDTNQAVQTSATKVYIPTLDTDSDVENTTKAATTKGTFSAPLAAGTLAVGGVIISAVKSNKEGVTDSTTKSLPNGDHIPVDPANRVSVGAIEAAKIDGTQTAAVKQGMEEGPTESLDHDNSAVKAVKVVASKPEGAGKGDVIAQVTPRATKIDSIDSDSGEGIKIGNQTDTAAKKTTTVQTHVEPGSINVTLAGSAAAAAAGAGAPKAEAKVTSGTQNISDAADDSEQKLNTVAEKDGRQGDDDTDGRFAQDADYTASADETGATKADDTIDEDKFAEMFAEVSEDADKDAGFSDVVV